MGTWQNFPSEKWALQIHSRLFYCYNPSCYLNRTSLTGPPSALKEAKGLSVPVAQYTAEGLPTIDLHYKEVSDTEIIQNGSVKTIASSIFSTSNFSSKEHKFVTLKVYNEVAIELCMACLKFIKKTQVSRRMDGRV